MDNIPTWFQRLYSFEEDVVSDIKAARIQADWAIYQDYRDEGHSRAYILVRVLGLQDPSW